MEANNKASSDAPIRFNSVLGRADLMAISMGLIIGAGIITLTGIAIRMTGRSVCIAFILAAGIIAITNIPFSYVAGTIRVEGGQYTQMALFAPKFVTGIYLYIYVFATIALSMYGISFANYFLQLVPGANLQLVAILAITAMFLLNFLGIKSVAKAQILMVVLTTLALTLFICFGINHVKPDYFEPKGFFRNGTIGLMTATALLTFAADGAKSIINFSPECKDPTRDIPFVMTVSTLAVGFLYARFSLRNDRCCSVGCAARGTSVRQNACSRGLRNNAVSRAHLLYHWRRAICSTYHNQRNNRLYDKTAHPGVHSTKKSFDFDDFEHKAKNPRNSLFFFCNPHNPTGRVFTEAELHRIADICFKNNVFVVSDEIHCDIIRVGEKHIPLAKLYPNEKRIITCTAPSKTFNLAGNQLSNIIITDLEIANEWRIKRYCGIANPLSIDACRAVYEECEDWLEALKLYLDDSFKFVDAYLKEHLPKANFFIPVYSRGHLFRMD